MAEDTGYTLTENTVKRLAKVTRLVLGSRGASVDPELEDGEDFTLIKIVSSTSLGEDKYEYTVRVVSKKTKHTTEDIDTADNPVKAYNWFDIGGGGSQVGTGKVVPAVLRADADGKPEYWFVYGGGGLPPVQYMGMYIMGVSQNQVGASFPFFGAYIG